MLRENIRRTFTCFISLHWRGYSFGGMGGSFVAFSFPASISIFLFIVLVSFPSFSDDRCTQME